MFGLSYGQMLLLIGATAAVVGPKELPIIARTVGRFTGRAIAHIQLFRGQLDSVMQKSEATQVHKELKETMAQLEAIRYEIRNISILNPTVVVRNSLDERVTTKASNEEAPILSGSCFPCDESKKVQQPGITKDSGLFSVQSQATAYARLAELSASNGEVLHNVSSDDGTSVTSLVNVLPVSAEVAGLLPPHREDMNGSDIALEAKLEADVALKAKNFFVHPQVQTNQ